MRNDMYAIIATPTSTCQVLVFQDLEAMQQPIKQYTNDVVSNWLLWQYSFKLLGRFVFLYSQG